METLLQHITPTFEVKDDRFDVGNIPHCHLLIEISQERFSFCVVQDDIKTCVWLEDYRFYSLIVENQWFLSLKEIYNEHSFLAANYWKSIVVLADTPHFTFVPTEFFKDEDTTKYLQLLTGEQINDKEQVYYHKHPEQDLTNIFSIDKKVVAWFREMYPARYIKFCHQSCVMLNDFSGRKHNQKPTIHLFFNEKSVTVQVFQLKTMLYCNRFILKNPADLVYYVSLIIKELHLPATETSFILSGEITTFSENYQNLALYFSNLSFGTLPRKMAYSQYFEDIVEHRYINLFSSFSFV